MHKSFLFRYKLHYLIALAGFAVWMLFFDEKDYFTQQKRKKELQKLEQKIEYYKTEIAETRKQVNALDKDPAMLEKYAREKYFMKRDNEDVYIIELPNDSTQSKVE
jgi:cell division protein FtsB